MDLKGKKVLILELNKEGAGVCQALQTLGAKPLLLDCSANEGRRRAVLEKLDVMEDQVFLDDPSNPQLLNVSLAIVAGPRTNYPDILETLQQKNIPVLSPLELSLQYSKVPIVAVTGTNGKSTVAKMIEKMMLASGKKVFLGGGSFEAYSALISRKKNWDVAILVVGSAVLQECKFFKPQVSIITNLMPAHMERHSTRSDYFDAKAKIFLDQTDHETLIYNADNKYVVELVQKAKASLLPFYLSNPQSYSQNIGDCAFYEKGSLFYKEQSQVESFFIQQKFMKAPHQRANALCAIAASCKMAVGKVAIQNALDTFETLPHRLQKCFEKNGLIFYDDSRSSNPAATAWGLMAFQKPVVLIMGGLYWGASYHKLKQYLKERVKLLIIFGEGRRKMFSGVKGVTETYLVNSLSEAVSLAIVKSHKGDEVVFSPAAPPEPELYEGYSGRGDCFIKTVKEALGVEMEKKRLYDTLHSHGMKI